LCPPGPQDSLLHIYKDGDFKIVLRTDEEDLNLRELKGEDWLDRPGKTLDGGDPQDGRASPVVERAFVGQDIIMRDGRLPPLSS
jgi:hypothetical protein